MIILRQKNYSEFSDTVLNWAKKFTPRIPIGNIRLNIIWPGTVLGALVGVFVGGIKELAKIFKHSKSINSIGKPSTEHINTEEHSANDLIRERHFSDTPLKSDFFDYCKVIPGYKSLAYLNNLNFKLLEGTSEDWKKNIWKYFPSFLVLSTPEEITSYRKDYLSAENPSDYAEILFMYGNELKLIWDFDRESWYVMDFTYNPPKEWKIGGKEDLEKVLLNFCDPDKDELLKHRIESAKDESMANLLKKYCSILSSMVKDSFKY